MLANTINKKWSNGIKIIKTHFSTSWHILLISFIFRITRIRHLTYPLGLIHRQYLKEIWRSYSAIISNPKFSLNILNEQPIYVFLLKNLYIISGKSPDGLVFLARVMGSIFLHLSLILIYKINEMVFGEITAKFTAFLYSISPYVVFIGIGIQRQTLMWLFGLCAIYFFLKYLRTEKNKFIMANMCFSLLSLMSKFTCVYFIFTCLVLLILFYSKLEPRRKGHHF